MQYHLAADSPGDVTKLGPGAYGVLFQLERDVIIATGRLGEISYPRGWYVYVGSAMGGISGRLKHHLGPHTRIFWHIDYVLPQGTLIAVVVGETDQRVECQLASHLRDRFTGFEKFGSSDCRCEGHLFMSDAYEPLLKHVVNAFESVNCRPRVMEVVSDSSG